MKTTFGFDNLNSHSGIEYLGTAQSKYSNVESFLFESRSTDTSKDFSTSAKRICKSLSAVLGFTLLLSGNDTIAQSYQAVEIEPFVTGWYTRATAINTFGQVTGYSVVSGGGNGGAGAIHGFITGANGIGTRDLNVRGEPYSTFIYEATMGTAINTYGQVAAAILGPDGPKFLSGPNGIGFSLIASADLAYRGTQYLSGVNSKGQVSGQASFDYGLGTQKIAFLTGANGAGMTPIGGLGTSSFASAINEHGRVTGYFEDSSNPLLSSVPFRGFVTAENGNGVTYLASLDGNGSMGLDINDDGYIVGVSSAPSGFRAFITGAGIGNVRDLGTLGGAVSIAYGINSRRQVVGESAYGAPSNYTQRHAFVTSPDGMAILDLNTITVGLPYGEELWDAVDINDLGQIVANGPTGRAYILSPIPEPSEYLMLSVGLLIVTLLSRKRKATFL